jgi:restriction system protein
MAIPDFQTIMLPLLKFCADGNEYTNQQALESLAEHFKLDDTERKQLLPSGQQCVFDNRVAWARAHMKMAELVENTKRGVFRITERGKNILTQPPSEINLRFLKQFPEYIKARDRSHESKKGEIINSTCDEQENKTPAERLEEAYMTLRSAQQFEIYDCGGILKRID